MELTEYLSDYTRSEYQRDNFDAFLEKIHFSYSVKSIHIAGTNGKGSTACYIASIYQESGRKVGLFNSPYFTRINEMILINGEEISTDAFIELAKPYEKLFHKYELSAFEIETFVALSYFQKEHVDIAVIECGLGGENDATNIFTPILSILTSVSLEHTAFLGTSISEITAQKCGILRPGTPLLISNHLEDDSKTVITSLVREYKSPLYVVDEHHFLKLEKDGHHFSYGPYPDLHILSQAEYSVLDADLAIEAVSILNPDFPIGEKAIRNGLEKVNMPYRFEILKEKPTLIIDGGHNPEAITALCHSLASYMKDRKVHTVLATFKDKNIEKILNEIALISEVTLTTFPHIRAREEMDYFLYLDDYRFAEDPIGLTNELLEAYPDDIVLVTGSLAFASYMKEAFIHGKIK